MGSHSQLDLSKKFKTANDRLRGISSSKDGWKPPLRKHFSPYGEVDFVTIQVRIFTGITEHNFHAKFLPGHHTAEKICSAIAEKEGLTPPEAQLFSLWVAGRDIEIQLKPKEDVFALMEDWNAWVSKYTHYPESIDPAHPINQHWFLYRREASLTTKAEIKVMRDAAQLLMYGQARWNYLAGRYLCTTQEAVDLAAIQLQSSIGNYDQEKCPPGFLDKDRISVLIPEYHLDAFKAKEWESIIVDKFKQYSGYSAVVSRQQFLSLVRKLPCYGASFFPCCSEVPPSGFFEHRTQNWFLAVGPKGISILDYSTNRYVRSFDWENIRWSSSNDQFFITEFQGKKKKQFELISPQARLADNLSIRCKYKWAKESGKWLNGKPE